MRLHLSMAAHLNRSAILKCVYQTELQLSEPLKSLKECHRSHAHSINSEYYGITELHFQLTELENYEVLSKMLGKLIH